MEYRQVALDVETTGLNPKKGHRIIEIAAIEVTGRRFGKEYRQLINPEREVDPEATKVHGYTWNDLKGYPTFEKIVDNFLSFVGKCDIIGHNIPFDCKFIDAEINRLPNKWTTDAQFDFEKYVRQGNNRADHLDTYKMAKDRFPNKKRSLDHICGYLNIDYQEREKHGALLDAKLAALCYLAMTRGTPDMFKKKEWKPPEIRRIDRSKVGPLTVIYASDAEKDAEIEMFQWMMSDPFRKSPVGSRSS